MQPIAPSYGPLFVYLLAVAACGFNFALHGGRRLRARGSIRYSSRALIVLSWLAGVQVAGAVWAWGSEPLLAAAAIAALLPWTVAFAFYRQRRRAAPVLDGQHVAAGGVPGAIFAGLLVTGGWYLQRNAVYLGTASLAMIPLAVVLSTTLDSTIAEKP